MAPGIEIFGRRATVVETTAPATSMSEPRRRRAWLGAIALVLGVATAVLTALGVGAAAAGDESAAQWSAIGAIGASILSILIALVAMITGRGRAVGALALVIAVLANPWILLRVLELFSSP